MDLEKALFYGLAVWGWLASKPLVLFLLGGLFIALGAYYTLKPYDSSAATSPTMTSLLSSPSIVWEDGKVILRGTFTREGKSINAYVTYGNAGERTVRLHGAVEPRIKIDSVSQFDEGAQASILVGTTQLVQGGQHTITWGRPEFNNKSVGITWGSYLGCVVLVEPSRKPEFYSFAIVNRSTLGQPPVAPVILGPPVIADCSVLLKS